ncbi:MAG: hypothetical protein ACI9Y1_003121 [Lentisphaeria bacterium]|jgi:hypothetical protein
MTLASLFIVSAINRQQLRSRVIEQKLIQMKRRVSELDELSATLEPLVETSKIPIIVNDEVTDLLKSMIKLAPENRYFQISLENTQTRHEDLSNPTLKKGIFRLMESDATIARAQYALAEAARVVRKRQANGVMELAEMESYIRDLAWANFMVKVTSHVGQGHKAIGRGDILRAHAFYRKAMEVATEGGHKDERQNQLISEIGEILKNHRKSLSASIMPETLYNPDAKNEHKLPSDY